MKQRVILVNPKMCSSRSVRLPLSLLALGAILEGRYDYQIVDGNVDPDAVGTVRRLLDRDTALVAVTVMPGPQVAPAIEISRAAKAVLSQVPIVWGGYFPTLYSESAVNASYVDFVIRGLGEDTLVQLLEQLEDAGPRSAAPFGGAASSVGDASAVADIAGLTWKRSGEIVHNADRPFRSPDVYPPFPYERLDNVEQYLRPSFLGSRTAVHQATTGCRYRCSFCGVHSMFDGYTELQGPERLSAALTILRDRYGANAVQYYDHNFFDREENSLATLEVLARFQLPWWCYARADTLAQFSTKTWELMKQSRLRMAYIGAEAATDAALKRMKKGSKVEYTLEVAQRCREYGVTPEFSFVLGGPEDPEAEIEQTLEFIKRLKKIHPECEVILYFYGPTPQRDPAWTHRGQTGPRLPVLSTYGPDGPALPTTPEEWTQPRWIDYVCHQDAPWLSRKLRRRIKGFSRVLYCRFPTVQDHTTPRWGKLILSHLARWRYETGRYERPWELDVARRLIRLREPQRESI